jgi:hypothetical protein
MGRDRNVRGRGRVRRSRREIHERYLSVGVMTGHDNNLRSEMMSTSEHFHSAVVQRRASGSSSLGINGTCATVAAHIVPPEAGGEGLSGNLKGERGQISPTPDSGSEVRIGEDCFAPCRSLETDDAGAACDSLLEEFHSDVWQHGKWSRWTGWGETVKPGCASGSRRQQGRSWDPTVRVPRVLEHGRRGPVRTPGKGSRNNPEAVGEPRKGTQPRRSGSRPAGGFREAGVGRRERTENSEILRGGRGF